MICPWLVKTVTETDNKNSFNQSRRIEHQEFDKCMKNDCPFYRENAKNKCLRARAVYFDTIPLEEI